MSNIYRLPPLQLGHLKHPVASTASLKMLPGCCGSFLAASSPEVVWFLKIMTLAVTVILDILLLFDMFGPAQDLLALRRHENCCFLLDDMLAKRSPLLLCLPFLFPREPSTVSRHGYPHHSTVWVISAGFLDGPVLNVLFWICHLLWVTWAETKPIQIL